MVRLRDARYSNLKVLLTYLVIYGHWIEPLTADSALALWQYKLIYLFHMPLFAFLSGLFVESAEDCERQIRRLLPLYLPLQSLMTAAGAAEDLWTPWWVLWYLLSDCLWLGFGWLWLRAGRGRFGTALLVALVVLGAWAGNVPWLDRTLSGSRSAVFLPCFFAGLLCPPDIQWQKYRRMGALALAAASGPVYMLIRRVPADFLYHAGPFGAVQNGFALRMACYAAGGLLCFALLTLAPGKRCPFTRAGGDTLAVYLIHAPAVLILRRWTLGWGGCMMGSALLLYAINKWRQWTGAVYGIRPSEGGDGGVRLSGDI